MVLTFDRTDQFILESLQKWDSQPRLRKYAKLWAAMGLYHQVIVDLEYGTDAYNDLTLDTSGRAKRYGGKGNVIPMVNWGMTPTSHKTMMGISGAEWTWMDLRKQVVASQGQFAVQTNIINNYAIALERSLQEFVHFTTIYGDKESNFAGLLTQPQVTVHYFKKNAHPFGVEISGRAQAQMVYDFFRYLVARIRDITKLTMTEGLTVLGTNSLQFSLGARFADGSGTGTVESTLRGQTAEPGAGSPSQTIRSFNFVNELQGKYITHPDFGNLSHLNGVPVGENDDVFLIYNANVAETLKRHAAAPDYFPVERQKTDYSRLGIVGTSEVIVPNPLEMHVVVLEDASIATQTSGINLADLLDVA